MSNEEISQLFIQTQTPTLFNITIPELEQHNLEKHKIRQLKRNPNYTLDNKSFKILQRKNLPSTLLCNVEAYLLNALIQDLLDQKIQIVSIEKDGLIVFSETTPVMSRCKHFQQQSKKIIGRQMPVEMVEWTES